MARIRTIKPETWTDEKLVAISAFARLAFIGLWNFVDDYGRMKCSPARLKMQILPSDPVDFRQLLEEISGTGLITIYDIDGTTYLQVNGFCKHQKIDKRSKSNFPPPPISSDSRQFQSLDQGKERIKEGKESAAPDGAQPADEESDLFRRGKQILGPTGGGLIKKLLTAKDGKIPLARSAIEMAATKQDPREYIGAIIRNRDGPTDARARGDAW